MSICRCSFCGLSQNDVDRLVASSNSATAICTKCTMRVLEVFATGDDLPDSIEPCFELTPLGREVAERISGEPHR